MSTGAIIALAIVALGAAYRLGQFSTEGAALMWERRYRVGRIRSLYWLRLERNKRRDIQFYAMELEEELNAYRKEAEERLWN